MSQAQSRQQPTLQDSQMLQRQYILKQLQELQKRQQFPELADGRQQNYLNQQLSMSKQTAEMFMTSNMNLIPHGASASVQGFSNGFYLQPQAQDLRMMGMASQQHDGSSLYGTPVASSRNIPNQFSQFQGLSPDSSISFNKSSNNLAGNHSLADGTFLSKQFLDGNNLFGQARVEGLGTGTLPENFQQNNPLQVNISSEEFNRRQDQRGSAEQFQGKATEREPSTLDPLEQKILFNMDDNSWNSSFGSNTEVGNGGYTNTLECSDYLSSFPSLQSGSWSALMQSAVAEASSSDTTAVQEEWSSLSFQKTKLSMDNQLSINGGKPKQQNNLVDNNNFANLNGKDSVFSGFQQPGAQFLNKPGEGTRSDSSHESLQQSPKVVAKWHENVSQQRQLPHTNQPLGNNFPFQGFEYTDVNARQRSTSGTDCGPLVWDPEGGSLDASVVKSHDQTPSIGSSLESRMQQGNQDGTSTQLRQPYLLAAQSPQATSPNITSKRPPFDLFISQGASQSSSVNRVGQQFPVLETTPVNSNFPHQVDFSKRPPSPWTHMSPQTRPSGTESQDPRGQNSFEGTTIHESSAGLTNSQGFVYGEEHHVNKSSHQRLITEAVGQGPPQNGSGSDTLIAQPQQPNYDRTDVAEKQVPSVSARDFEAFGRSLKPSNLHPNYSSTSERKHKVGSVSGLKPEGQGEKSGKPPSSPFIQNNTEEMSSQAPSSSHGDTSFSDVAFHRKDPSSQFNLQMAAALFKQYGTFKNGQMLAMYDTSKINSMQPLGKHLENLDMKTFMVPPNVTGACQFGNNWPNTSTTLAEMKLSDPCSLPSDSGDPNLAITRSKKRKIASSELLPWHKEVIQSTERLQSISVAEIEWAKAVNRLIQKVGVEMIEDVQPLFRQKRRLIRTTQLMQQVFMPAPAAFLSAEATLTYDSVAYFSAKLALVDACNLKSCLTNDPSLCSNSDDMITDKSESSEKIDEKRFSPIVEDLTSRAKKLEADFHRLNKTASVTDVIVEYKDMEKFSIINRFARFHMRGQQNSAEAPTSSSGSTSGMHKPAPRRYVMAYPMPKAVPERAQCFTL